MEPERQIGSADDAAGLLDNLRQAKKPEVIKQGLIQILIYLRTTYALRGSRTESIAEIETQVIAFLNAYHGSSFPETYAVLHEIISLIPKFHIFGIDIIELRDITHDFDAAYRYHPAFQSIASDIRRLVHQNLSVKVITKIEKFEEFLRSEKSTDIVDGSMITDASSPDKQNLLHSPLFTDLLLLKDKLKTAWAHKQHTQGAAAAEKEFTRVIRQCFENLPQQELAVLQSDQTFKCFLEEPGMLLAEQKRADSTMGRIRYHLNRRIAAVATGDSPARGDTLFRLITLDVLLERAAFIYYSNLVNSSLREITDANYTEALTVLCSLALCTRAVGHGNINLVRFAFLLESLLAQLQQRPDRAAHFPTLVDAMRSAMEDNFSRLQELYGGAVQDVEKQTVNKIINNIFREKTTHLLGNLINNISQYHDGKKVEPFNRVLQGLPGDASSFIKDMVFRFGTDVVNRHGKADGPEYMGGKGFSQVTSSRILAANGLRSMDVPKGGGFSTLTWQHIKNSAERMSCFRRELRALVDDIEVRTGKRLGDPDNPLLLMARSGGVISMPGILDTINHIGITAQIAENWAETLEEPGRAYQAYIGFLVSYAQSVLGLSAGAIFNAAGVARYELLCAGDRALLRDGAKRIREAIQKISGRGPSAISDDLFEQLYTATIAVFKSYENDIVLKQARTYGIPEQFQTACLIQECMPVLSSRDCSGVFFTRNPVSGRIGSPYAEHIEFGEGFFGNVIADGLVTPAGTAEFIERYPQQYALLKEFKYFDEREQRYPTDIEFAVRDNILYIVQSRILKQSPIALIVNSYDFYREEIYSEFKLIKRTAFSLNKPIRQTYLDRKQMQNAPLIAIGQPVTGGAIRGRIVFNPESIGTFPGPLILVTENNVPPKVIMQEKNFIGYISKEGGITSHAALVAIGEKKPCVTGVNWERGDQDDEIIIGGFHFKEGDLITLDANTGTVYREEIPIIESGVIDDEFTRIKDSIVDVLDAAIYDNFDG